MKKLILIVFLSIISISSSFAQSWNVVSEPFSKSTINDVFFISENEGFIAGDSGYVFHTANGGQTWEKQVTPSKKSIKKLFFLNASYGWAGTGQGSILITTDGGQKWTESSFASVIPGLIFTYCDAICFVNQNVGFIAAGKDKAIYLLKTTDGGQSWVKKDSLVGTISRRWYDISFYDQDKGIVVGDKKDIFRYTTNGGEKWESSSIADNFFGIQRTAKWLSSSDVITLGDGNDFNGVSTPIYKSTDGGQSWTKKSISAQCFDRIKDVYFKNSKEAVAVGSNGFSKMFLAKTSDGGETWTQSAGPFSFGLQVVTGFNNTLYVLGNESHLAKSTDFGNTWNIIPNKTTSSIYSIKFKGGRGYALSRTSDVFISEDGKGDNWKYGSSAGQWDAYSMCFTSSTTGFVQKENRHILKTTDGGLTWKTVLEAVDFNAKNKVGGITFPDENTGYAWFTIDSYSDFRLYKTTNAGESWTAIDTIAGPGTISGDIAFFDANTGVIAGPKRWLVRTSNGGATWDTVKINNVPSNIASSDFEDLFILDNSHAWAIGEKVILFSSDKGLNWNYVDHGVKNIDSSFYAVSFYNDKLGYIGCYDGAILKTTDGGKTWSADLKFKDIYRFYSSAFNENGEAFLGTSNGVILSDKQFVGVNEEKASLPMAFSLEQNYPNPFNPSTSIKFSLTNDQFVSLKVFDLMGREVRSLISRFYKAGTYTINFDAKDLSSGIYYYQLKAGSNMQTRKMTLLK